MQGYICKIHEEQCPLFKVQTNLRMNQYTEVCIVCYHEADKQSYVPIKILVQKIQEKLNAPTVEYDAIVTDIEQITDKVSGIQDYLEKIKGQVIEKKETVEDFLSKIQEYCDKILSGQDQDNLQQMLTEIAQCTLYEHNDKKVTLKPVKDFNQRCKESEDDKKIKQQIVKLFGQKSQITGIVGQLTDTNIKSVQSSGGADPEKVKEFQENIQRQDIQLRESQNQVEQLNREKVQLQQELIAARNITQAGGFNFQPECGFISDETKVEGQCVQLFQCNCMNKKQRLTFVKRAQELDDNYEDPEVFENLVGNNPYPFEQGVDDIKKICQFRRHANLGNTFWVVKNIFNRFEGYPVCLKDEKSPDTQLNEVQGKGVLLIPTLSVLYKCGQVGSAYYCIGEQCQNRDPKKLKLWGSNPYTHDSNYCNVAKHFGVNQQTGGFIIKGNLFKTTEDFTGSTKNGITSKEYKAMKGIVVY